jgi:hypothetical protein
LSPLFAADRKMDELKLVTPKNTDQFLKLMDQGYKYLNEQQEICKTKYDLGSYERWFYDQEKGLITFSDDGIVKLKIKYEEVGSISKVSHTWLWGWANPHLHQNVKSVIEKVRSYGETHGFEKLTKRKWQAEEIDCWEMTAISALLLKAKGAYRVPTEKTFSFMLFMEIEDLRK